MAAGIPGPLSVLGWVPPFPSVSAPAAVGLVYGGNVLGGRGVALGGPDPSLPNVYGDHGGCRFSLRIAGHVGA